MHYGDIPADLKFNGDIAVDTEAMGLNNKRDRLCVVQVSDGGGDAHLVKFAPGAYDVPNLKKLLSDPNRTKLYHFARFDLSIMQYYLGINAGPVYCTRTASRLVRTYTDRHGLKDICRELIGVEISKQQQSSDWGAEALTPEQIEYAAADVLHLHKLREKLNVMIAREGRQELFNSCMNFLPHRAALDIAGWEDQDIFAHS